MSEFSVSPGLILVFQEELKDRFNGWLLRVKYIFLNWIQYLNCILSHILSFRPVYKSKHCSNGPFSSEIQSHSDLIFSQILTIISYEWLQILTTLIICNFCLDTCSNMKHKTIDRRYNETSFLTKLMEKSHYFQNFA